MKRSVLIAAAALVVAVGAGVAFIPQRTHAEARFSSADATYIRKDEVIDGSAYIAGSTITVDGTIKGDLYCAGQTVTITGTVDGDIICAGQNIDVSGHSGGSMRLAGQTVRMRGESGGSLSVFAQAFETENSTKVAKDLNGAAGTIQLSGSYGRDIAMSGQNMTITGVVARDVAGDFETLKIDSGAQVLGNVSYTSATDGVIAGKVAGKVSRTPVDQQNRAQSNPVVGWIVMAFVAVLGGLLAIIMIVAIMPKRVGEMAALARRKPGRVVLWGLGLAFVMPPLLLFLLVSGVGIALAIVLGAMWLLLALTASAFVAYFVGGELFKKVQSAPLRTLLGGVIVLIAYVIPFVNVLAYAVVSIFGTGMALAYLENKKVFER